MSGFSSFRDLAGYGRRELARDLPAGLAVAFLAVPQGVAYALIAGIPPAMGLYAATLPALLASLLRSSRHVVAGPTNAVSLLVGSAVAIHADLDPATMAVTLALMVGVIQVTAGGLRLGALVDWISAPVVLGYITGAGLLIGLGQLHNVTGTVGGTGRVDQKLLTWVGGLGDADLLSIGVALGTAVVIVVLRKLNRRLPGAILAMAGAIALTMVLGLDERGLTTIADVSVIEGGLPALTLPDLSLVQVLLPTAVAVAVLSMVESSSVARDIASRSGQRLALSSEFLGEGVANLSAAFLGAYPVTGSLSRSALNEREGAATRASGMMAAVVVMGGVVLAGPLLNFTPIASLAGLLLVVAVGLVHTDHIRRVMRSHLADKLSFVVTVAGCMTLHLDQAIYLGVGISLVSYLRQARLVRFRDLVVDGSGRLREVSPRGRRIEDGSFVSDAVQYCAHVHVLNVQGSLFFGAAGELQAALDEVMATRATVLVLRLKRARHLDVTISDVLVAASRQLSAEGRHLMIVGLTSSAHRYLDEVGTLDELGRDKVFARSRDHWFAALEEAVQHALELAGQPESPYADWLAGRDLAG